MMMSLLYQSSSVKKMIGTRIMLSSRLGYLSMIFFFIISELQSVLLQEMRQSQANGDRKAGNLCKNNFISHVSDLHIPDWT